MTVGAVDFTEWVAPDLVLTLGGRTYTVAPPSVERAKKIIALAVRGEVKLNIVRGEIPDEVQEVLDTLGPLERPALGDVAQLLVDDGVAVETIDRMHYYAIFYWARGKEYADTIATVLWARRAEPSDGGPAPKALPRSPLKSGRGMAKGNRSTTT